MRIDYKSFPKLWDSKWDYKSDNIKYITGSFIEKMAQSIGALDSNILNSSDTGILLFNGYTVAYGYAEDGLLIRHDDCSFNGNGTYFDAYLGEKQIGNLPEKLSCSLNKDEFDIILTAQRILFFLKYAEIQTKVLSNNAVSGIKCINEKVYSDSKLNIEVVDSTWFTNIIRTAGFNVKGHFRLQPYGEGMKDKKLIWINDFQKNGYTRLARMLNPS